MKVSNFKLRVKLPRLASRATPSKFEGDLFPSHRTPLSSNLLPHTFYCLLPSAFCLLLFAFCFFSVFSSYGQLSTREEPISFKREIPALTLNETTQKIMPSLDMAKIEQEDKEDEENGVPPRFGFSHKVSFNLDNSGEWIELENGDKIWRLSIYCPNALSINLSYDRFWIPDGAKLFVYSNDKKHSIGAFTSNNNKGGSREDLRGFATGMVYGNTITVEYYVPNFIEDIGIISIAYIIHGYRYIQLPEKERAGFGQSQSCIPNVNCDNDAEIQKQKNAVALVLVNNERYCTGSLLNTTANDNTPYFLTANHCLGGWANEWVQYDAIDNPYLDHFSFYWQYESPSCNLTTDGPILSSTGATVVANDYPTDFALLLLDENPASIEGVTPYYLGWSRVDNTNKGENPEYIGVGIHHPQGDVKKISYMHSYFNYPLKIPWTPYYETPANTHWVVFFNIGFTEGGSSGSPVLDGSWVVGQLHGGNSYQCPPYEYHVYYDEYYGRFDVSWNGYETSDSCRRLKEWLDPINLKPPYINGTGYHCLTATSLTGIATGPNYYHATDTITSTQEIESGSTTYKAGELITLLPGFHAKSGSDFTAQIEECDIIQRTILSVSEMEDQNVPENSIAQNLTQSLSQPQVNLHPNPNSGTFQLETNFSLSDIFTLKVMDMLGVTVY